MRGPMKIPRFPVKAKILKALACVFLVLISEIIVRIVLGSPSDNVDGIDTGQDKDD